MEKQLSHLCNHTSLRSNLQLFFLAMIGVFTNSCHNSDSLKNEGQKIIVKAHISKYFYQHLQGIYSVKDEMNLYYQPFPNKSPAATTISASGKVINGQVTWILYSRTPVKVTPPFGTSMVMNPGDSTYVDYLYDYPIYSGTNASALDMLTALMKTEEKLFKTQKKNSYNVRTLEDYMEWNQYLNDKLALHLPIIEYYKDKIPPVEHDYYAANTIHSIESNRVDAFQGLRDTVVKGYPGLSLIDLCNIWDSTQYKPSAQWLRSLSDYHGSIGYIYAFNRMELFRQFGFDANDSLASNETRSYLYYTKAKKQYKGLMLEKLLTHILDEPIIIELGLKNPTAQTLLKDYYNLPGYPEYKEWVKGLEKQQQEKEKAFEKKKKDKMVG